MKVTTSNFQKRLQDSQKKSDRPGTGEVHSVPGILIEIYDQEYLEEQDIELSESQKLYEGMIFALVKLGNGITSIFPFKETESLIHQVYGNSILLEGRRCRVEFNGINIYNGHIVLERNYLDRQINLDSSCKALDIGGII